MTRTRFLPVFVAVLLGTSACPWDSSNGRTPATVKCATDDPPADERPASMLGRSASGKFAPLEPGADVRLERGPQGGRHIFFSVRSYAAEGTQWNYLVRLSDAGTGSVLGETTFDAKACAPGWTETLDEILFVDSSTIASAAPGPGDRLRLESALVGGAPNVSLTSSVTIDIVE